MNEKEIIKRTIEEIKKDLNLEGRKIIKVIEGYIKKNSLEYSNIVCDIGIFNELVQYKIKEIGTNNIFFIPLVFKYSGCNEYICTYDTFLDNYLTF